MAHPLEPAQIVSLLTSAPLKKTICLFAGSKINITNTSKYIQYLFLEILKFSILLVSMSDTTIETTINRSPFLKSLYTHLISELKQIGTITVEPKKTSVHVVAKSAFVGIHSRKDYLIINIVSDKPIKSSRIFKVEQVSKSRFHNHIKIAEKQDIDNEVKTWFINAYNLLS